MKLRLASQSPRRRALLEELGVEELVIAPPKGEECWGTYASPEELVESLSKQKVAQSGPSQSTQEITLGADTVVVLDHQVMGKPATLQEAQQMLTQLSGRDHLVYTGVTLQWGTQILTRHECTRVFFRKLSAQDIQAYLATGEPMDKAGGYGIQGYGRLLVRRLEGDYFNVVGLPLGLLEEMMGQLGLSLWTMLKKREG